jgi:hypothetical protein
MKGQPVDGDEGLIVEEGVNDNATDYNARKDNKSEVGDDLGILGDQNEVIQPVVKAI